MTTSNKTNKTNKTSNNYKTVGYIKVQHSARQIDWKAFREECMKHDKFRM